MATKITQETWDKIGRQIISNSEGITNLVNDVLHYCSEKPRGSISDWAKQYVAEGNIWAYVDDMKFQLDKLKIPYRDPEKKFVDVYSRAVNKLVNDYLKKHKLTVVRSRNQWGSYSAKLVKE